MSSINVTSFFISCTEDITELSWTGNSTKFTQINITNQSYLIYILKPLKNIFILSHLKKKHFQSAEFYIEKNNIKTSIFHSQSFLSLFFPPLSISRQQPEEWTQFEKHSFANRARSAKNTINRVFHTLAENSQRSFSPERAYREKYDVMRSSIEHMKIKNQWGNTIKCVAIFDKASQFRYYFVLRKKRFIICFPVLDARHFLLKNIVNFIFFSLGFNLLIRSANGI